MTPADDNGPASDAIVLFNGKYIDAWDGAANWTVDADGGFTAKGAIPDQASAKGHRINASVVS